MLYFFAKVGFAMFFAAFLSSFLRMDIIFAAAAVFAVFGFCLFFFGKKYRDFAVVFCALSAGCAIVAFELLLNFYPAMALDGMTADVSGKVTEVSAAGGNPVFTVETDYIGIEGAPQNIKIKITGWEDNSAKPFDKISCRVSFISYSEKTDEEILTDRSRGISVYAYTKTAMNVTGSDHSSPGYYIYLIREGISSVIYRYFADWHAPFMEQLLIGTRGDLPAEISSPFRKSGMSHILAISGLHMSVIIGSLEMFLRRFAWKKIGPNLRDGILFAATAFYMLIGGLGASILRSGFMLMIHYAAKTFFRGSKAPDNLGIAVIAILLYSPMSCCDAGFIMSSVSSLSLAVFARPFADFLAKILHLESENRLTEKFTASAAVSIIPFLAVLPVAVIYFGEVSLLAPVSNIIAGNFAMISLIFGIFAVIFGAVPFLGFFASGSAFIAMVSDRIMLETARAFSFSEAETDSFWLFLWVTGSAVLIIVPALLSQSFRYIPAAFIMSFAVFAAGIISSAVFFSGVTEIDVTALEHGTAVSCSKGKDSVLIVHNLAPYDRFRLYSDGDSYDGIISLEALSDGAEAEIMFVSDCDFAMLTFEDYAAENEHAMPFKPGYISLWEGGKLHVISEGVFSAEFDEINLLYISEKFDIMDIEPKFRRADIIILDGISPDEFSLLRSDYLIFRKTEGYYSGSSEIITLEEGEVSFFSHGFGLLKGMF
ncbi:MAG: ComEC/Rec2 family competence protein [Oscillospiraceae bacterium]|nr:ComEC/Rec2 family competence protein [Oscillospiraceae bacterium]